MQWSNLSCLSRIDSLFPSQNVSLAKERHRPVSYISLNRPWLLPETAAAFIPMATMIHLFSRTLLRSVVNWYWRGYHMLFICLQLDSWHFCPTELCYFFPDRMYWWILGLWSQSKLAGLISESLYNVVLLGRRIWCSMTLQLPQVCPFKSIYTMCFWTY